MMICKKCGEEFNEKLFPFCPFCKSTYNEEDSFEKEIINIREEKKKILINLQKKIKKLLTLLYYLLPHL